MGSKEPDRVASLTLAIVATVALAASWFLPWWAMHARAPQYGQRVLVVDVSPVRVTGDVFEVDTLGHYVGIKPMGSFAPLERKLAPFGLLAAIAGILTAPWLRRRWLRLAVLLPVLVLPLAFLVDLNFWMNKSVSERDLDAALNLTITKVDPRLLGQYELGQFVVNARMEAGLYLTLVAALLGLGLVFAVPLGRRVVEDVPGGNAAAAPARGGTLKVALAFVLSLGLGLASVAAGGVPAAGAAERTLGLGESLEAVIAASAAGDTIRVRAGVHTIHAVVVDRALSIVGDPGAVLDGGGAGTVLDVRASGVVVSGLMLRGSGESLTTEDAAVRIEKAQGTRIADCRIEDALFGVFVVDGDGTTIERTEIVGKDLDPDRRGDGIRIWHSNGCRLLGNHVERSRDVILWYSSDTLVEGNVVRHGRYGLHYMYSDRNVFRRNRFEDNLVGATIMYSRGIELTDNSFSYSTGPSAVGLLVKESNDVFIIGNRFVGNETAVFLDDAPQARGAELTLSRNLIARNDVGIALQPLTHGAVVWENALIGNRVQIQMLGTGSGEGNAWSKDGRGNYWSDAVLYDRDDDGVSEIPYRAESTFEALTERRPVLQWFASSPGADAIDGASRLFPIFAPRPKMTDPHPLLFPPPLSDAMRGGSVAGVARRAHGLTAAGMALVAGAALTGLVATKVLS